MKKRQKILLTGGGTLGPVMPLIAVAQELESRSNLKVTWWGTYRGPERSLVQKYSIPFSSVLSVKLRRYLSLNTIFIPVWLILASLQVIVKLIILRPHVIVSAGGYVSVPVVIIGKLFGIPSLIHQQDIMPGLANKIMSHFASVITVTFEQQKQDYDASKVKLTGNPVRKEIIEASSIASTGAKQELGFDPNKPLVLVIGGGTGSAQINNLIQKSRNRSVQLAETQILHVTGHGKFVDSNVRYYKTFEFLTRRMALALAAADIVIARAGMSSLTELSYLSKPAIIIPLPNSHQLLNARFFDDAQAIITLELPYKLEDTHVESFFEEIIKLLRDKNKRHNLSVNINKLLPDKANEHLAQEVKKLIK